MILRRAFRTVIGAATIVLAASRSSAADNEAARNPVVQMSPYEVSANSVAFEHWAKYSSPHFIVYSDASPEDAIRALNEFEFLHLAAVKYFDRPTFKRAPTIVVLPTDRSDWRKLESTAAVEWHVAVSQPAQRLQGMVLVGYNWQGWLVGDNVLLSSLGKSELVEMRIGGPLWFSSGIGMFFESTRFEDDAVTLGKPSLHARVQWRRGWLPWPTLFKATTSSPEYTKKDMIRIFTGQSGAFMHYLLTHRDPVWRERLMTWTAMMQGGREPTEEAFKSVFGQNWADWEKTMRAHAHDRSDKTATISLTAAEKDFPRNKVDIPPREMRELFVLAQVLNQKKPASEAGLDSLLAKGLKSEVLRELLVEACLNWKRLAAAQEQLQALIAENSTNAMVYVTRADLLFRARVPVITLRASLDEGREEIIRLSRKALELSPRHPDASNLLAWCEAIGSTVTPENVATIEKLARDLEGVAPTQEVVGALALAQLHAGDAAAARKTAQALIDSPFANKRMKGLMAALLRELDGGP